MRKGKCPSCGGQVNFDRKPIIGQRLYCGWCDVPLAVVRAEPIKLETVAEESSFIFKNEVRNGKDKNNPKCPLCGDKLKTSQKLRIGTRILCKTCDAELEVIGVRPLEFDWPYDSGFSSKDLSYEDEYEELEEYSDL